MQVVRDVTNLNHARHANKIVACATHVKPRAVPTRDLTCPRTRPSSACREPAMPVPPRKPILFISYARADEPERPGPDEIKWLSFVTGYLRPAEARRGRNLARRADKG